jgi:hypothetical protein
MQALLGPNSSLRWPLNLTAVAALVIALAYTFFFVFSRSMSLDEGYLMITVQGFNSGHALYDDVFTQYGPFYYFYEWLLHSMLQIPLTHDATRLLCAFHWITAAGLLGAAAWRMTRSALAAIFVSMQSLVHLSAIAHEPGHPQELVVVLVALGILAATRFASGKGSLGMLAVITALLVFTKINVGLFFGFALLLALRCHSTDRFARDVWNWLLLVVSAVLPVLLMRQHLAAEWCRNFALLASGATFTILFVAQRTAGERVIGVKNYFIMAGIFSATSVLLLSITLATGTSLRGLIDGLLLTPLKMASVALLPLPLSGAALVSTFASLAAAVFVLWKRNDSRVIAGVPMLKLLFALAGGFGLLGEPKLQIAFLLPWVWLVALPTSTDDKSAGFARVLLSLVAAWQSLQAYPIAGTQTTLATFPLVLAYGVCLADALRELARSPRMASKLSALTPSTRVLAGALACVALLFVFANAWCKLPNVRREYARLLPLDLPGTRWVRMNEELTAMNQGLARYLSAECDTFVSYPGINSLYFWADKKPPTQINSTGWGQLSFAQQEKILGSLRHTPRSKLVVTEAMMQSWGTPYADPIRPLVRFVTEECQPVKRIGRCLIFEPKPAAQLSAKE